jgi:hypothetical protein
MAIATWLPTLKGIEMATENGQTNGKTKADWFSQFLGPVGLTVFCLFYILYWQPKIDEKAGEKFTKQLAHDNERTEKIIEVHEKINNSLGIKLDRNNETLKNLVDELRSTNKAKQ